MDMGTWDLRLISSSFQQDGDESVIELYGRARTGESVTVLVPGFKPYFFIVDPDPSLENLLPKEEGIESATPDRLLYKSEMHDVLKVVFSDPRKLAEWKNRIRRTNRILAGDIPHHHRFFYDQDMGACIRVTGHPVEREYRTDAVIEMESFENIEPFDPGLRMLSFDIENSIEHETIYTICCVISDKDGLRACEPIYGEEKDIIAAFGDLIAKEDPDVITGYNIDNYDIRKIDERAKANRLKDAMPWGRDGSQPRLVGDRFWRVKGRVVCDAWWAVRRELRPKQETLNAVSMEILGEQKLDVDPKRMDAEWAENRDKVLEYCTKDAELALRILIEVGTVRKGMDLSTVSKLTLEDVLTSGSSQLVDSLLIRMADRNKVGVPAMGNRTASTDQIEGGYVHSMNPGLYHWVCVLDFKSMYPSLIIAKNICFTTLSPDGEIQSPSGARFMAKERRLGLLPRLLSDLMEERDSIKKRMKQTTDEHERRYLDGLQAAVKVLMNTFYGVFASTFYRFTDKSIGSAITSFARANVKGIITEVEGEGIPVIYSDTDSVFMQSPEHTLEGSIEFGTRMADRFSKDGGVLEFEKLLEPMFTHGMKKRYVGKVVWPTVSDELLVRGYEIRRSDSFDLQSDLLTGLFEKILEEKNDEALDTVRRTVQNTLSGNVPLESLVISRTCKGLDAYENPDRMANVQAAKKMIALGYEFIPGMKVSWIVTDGGSAPQKVEPYVSGFPFTAKPDYRYYAERIAQTASRITEVFGWTEKDLVVGNQQSTLFAFSPKEKSNRTAPRKPSTKKTKLDDFF